MALFALIAFCVMPIEAKKVKGNGDIITKEISVRDYSAIKVGSTAMGYSDSWFSLFSRGGNPSYVFGYTQGESASLRITIDENLYPYINVQVKNEELSISTENGTQLSPTRFKIEGTSKKLELLAKKHPDQIIRKDAHNFTVPKRCVSVREPYSAERRKAASERAKAAGYQPPVKKSGS